MTAASLLAMLLALYWLTQAVMMRSFTELERRRAFEDINRVRSAFLNSIKELDSQLMDWSAWDDAYEFMSNRNDRFIEANITGTVLSDIGVDMIMIVGPGGRVIYDGCYEKKSNDVVPVDAGLVKRILGEKQLVEFGSEKDGVRGVLMYEGTPVLIASRPVVTSNKKGPVRGALMFGRFFDRRHIEELSKITHFDISYAPVSDKGMTPDYSDALAALERGEKNALIRNEGAGRMRGYTTLQDLDGREALVMRVEMPREIFLLSRLSARYIYAIFIVIGLVGTGLILLVLERQILMPLARLVAHIKYIGIGGNLSARMSVAGGDELSQVAASVNMMLGGLEETEMRLRQQETLRESEERYRQLVEYSPDAVLILSEGKIVFANAAALLLLGAEEQKDALGRGLEEFLIPEDDEEFHRWKETMLSAYAPRFERSFKRRDGSMIFVELAGTAFSYQGKPAVQVVAHDATDRMRNELRISKANESFLGFGPDSDANIGRLTALCGELMGADFAFYARHDGGWFDTIAEWQMRGVFPARFPAAGSFIYDMVKDRPDGMAILTGATGSKYSSAEPILSAAPEALAATAVRFSNEFIGSLCVAYRRPVMVPDDDMKFMGIIASAIGVEEKRRLAEMVVQRRLEMEMAVSAVSARFVSAEDIENEIREALGELAGAAGADRAYLALFGNSERGRMRVEWRGDGQEESIGNALPPDAMPGLLRLLGTGEPLFIGGCGTIDQALIEEAKALGGSNFESLVLLPLYMGGALEGLLGIESPEKLSQCDDRDTAILKVTTEIIGNFIARRTAEERLRHMAYHDMMTGLPNRYMFDRMLRLAIAEAESAGAEFAVLLLDLDRFKDINDTMGHTVGDSVLKIVGARLQAEMREGDFLARYSGDEFLVIVKGIKSLEEAGAEAEKLYRTFLNPISIAGREVFLGASIGMAVYPSGGSSAEDLIMNADMAMYRAKEKERGRHYEVFNLQYREAASERKMLEDFLRRAVERDELLLQYQPKVEVSTRRIVGVEALVRWEHPTLGMLSPSKFIPIAEDTGTIVPIGDWVMRTACGQLRSWLDRGAPPIHVAVNLSARQFLDQRLLQNVNRHLKAAALPPECLELEITESTAMHNLDITLALLKEINRLGVRLSIDDFGTGYSSFGYLREFQFNSIKIAHDFIHDMMDSPDAGAIVQAIITMAHVLKKRVVAENVETKEQLEFLRAVGCDEIQGFYFSEPINPEQLEQILMSGGKFA